MGSLRVGQDWTVYFHFSLSCIGKWNGNPLQCSCLENPRDGGAWWAAFSGVSQSRTRLKRLSSSRSSSRSSSLELYSPQFPAVDFILRWGENWETAGWKWPPGRRAANRLVSWAGTKRKKAWAFVWVHRAEPHDPLEDFVRKLFLVK